MIRAAQGSRRAGDKISFPYCCRAEGRLWWERAVIISIITRRRDEDHAVALSVANFRGKRAFLKPWLHLWIRHVVHDHMTSVARQFGNIGHHGGVGPARCE